MSTQYCRVGKIIPSIETESESNENSMLLSKILDLNNPSENDLLEFIKNNFHLSL